ncbi:MAG TPA: hypothetical protein VEW26_01160, partial [Allosphingosinicella sp.]|nr:hypothetical protein [Allosphingosinicella sp.]
MVEQALKRHAYNISLAAQELGGGITLPLRSACASPAPTQTGTPSVSLTCLV